MGPDIDKLFIELAGQPVVAHAWRRMDSVPEIDAIHVVVRAGMESAFEDLATSLNLLKPWQIVVGGNERQDSVWNGLISLPVEARLVAIHDAARPCVSPPLVRRCLEAAERIGASVAACRCVDTIKVSDDGRVISEHPERSRLWAVQTPQCFRVPVILSALGAVRERGLAVTDDTAACQLIGQAVELVESREPNPKVTTPADCGWIEQLLSS